MPAGSIAAKLEAKLKRQYGGNDHAIYGTLNKLKLMRGNKVTRKGARPAKKPRGSPSPVKALGMLGRG